MKEKEPGADPTEGFEVVSLSSAGKLIGTTGWVGSDSMSFFQAQRVKAYLEELKCQRGGIFVDQVTEIHSLGKVRDPEYCYEKLTDGGFLEEVSDMIYQLRKLPLITVMGKLLIDREWGQLNTGEQEELLEQLPEDPVFVPAFLSRAKRLGSLTLAYQDENWVWDKVGEERMEMQLSRGGIIDILDHDIALRYAFYGRNAGWLLEICFAMASSHQVEPEAIIEFGIAKQRGRMQLTDQGIKLDEKQRKSEHLRLLPIAEKYFG